MFRLFKREGIEIPFKIFPTGSMLWGVDSGDSDWDYCVHKCNRSQLLKILKEAGIEVTYPQQSLNYGDDGRIFYAQFKKTGAKVNFILLRTDELVCWHFTTISMFTIPKEEIMVKEDRIKHFNNFMTTWA